MEWLCWKRLPFSNFRRWLWLLGISATIISITWAVAVHFPSMTKPTRSTLPFRKFNLEDLTRKIGAKERGFSFHKIMQFFPWSECQKASIEADWTEIRRLSTSLAYKMYPFVEKEPTISVNSSCLPPSFKTPNCTLLANPRKVAALILFSFDVDALEFHLHELNDLVDHFFLLESTSPHSDLVLGKPLVWASVKRQARFLHFQGKVVHFVVDESDLISAKGQIFKYGNHKGEVSWEREMMGTSIIWQKFQKWNNITKTYGPDDWLGFGDTDEIPWRDNVFQLKHCSFPFDTVDMGIWVPYPYVNTAVQSDFPVKGYSYTLGDPTYWTLKAAMATEKYPMKLRGKGQGYLLGGTHLSKYTYPPFQILKLLTATETEGTYVMKQLAEKGVIYQREGLKSGNERLTSMFIGNKLRLRTLHEIQTTDNGNDGFGLDRIVKLPWFYECNRKRYPSLEGLPDSRI